MKRKKGFYSISAVAQMFSIHPQTIRFYEQQGLILPKQTPGGTRMFEEEDIDRLEQVLYLTHELGVNLAGVEVVMKLQRQVKKLQKELNDKFDEVTDELSKREHIAKAVIKEDAQRLMKISSTAGSRLTEKMKYKEEESEISESKATIKTVGRHGCRRRQIRQKIKRNSWELLTGKSITKIKRKTGAGGIEPPQLRPKPSALPLGYAQDVFQIFLRCFYVAGA